MRIYLELGQVMRSPTLPRRRTLTALQRLLRAAERERVYLDITGNLVWRPARVPAWYDRLEERSRWRVQANFWRAVAGAAAASPAVLCYELTSEPIVGEGPEYYLGELEGWTFLQSIATRRGRRAAIGLSIHIGGFRLRRGCAALQHGMQSRPHRKSERGTAIPSQPAQGKTTWPA